MVDGRQTQSGVPRDNENPSWGRVEGLPSWGVVMQDEGQP